MTTHELKTDPAVFDDVIAGLKKFEIRFDDRDFKVDDILSLRKTMFTGDEMSAGKPLFYTDDFSVLVTHILTGPIYGLKDGWVIMSIRTD